MGVVVGIGIVADDVGAINADGFGETVGVGVVEGGVGLGRLVVEKAVLVAVVRIRVKADDIAAGNADGRGEVVRVGFVEGLEIVRLGAGGRGQSGEAEERGDNAEGAVGGEQGAERAEEFHSGREVGGELVVGKIGQAAGFYNGLCGGVKEEGAGGAGRLKGVRRSAQTLEVKEPTAKGKSVFKARVRVQGLAARGWSCVSLNGKCSRARVSSGPDDHLVGAGRQGVDMEPGVEPLAQVVIDRVDAGAVDQERLADGAGAGKEQQKSGGSPRGPGDFAWRRGCPRPTRFPPARPGRSRRRKGGPSRGG